MRKKENNRGFTLVELIIAVAILAVVVAPLMSNFVQSSKMNLKGRKSMNATNLAQAVMEGMSAYSVSEVDEFIQDEAAVSLQQNILPDGMGYGTITREVVMSTKPDEPDVVDTYTYTISDVEAAESGQYSKYDVKIIMNAATTPGVDHNLYNDVKMAEVTEIDQYYDAVYTVPTGELSRAFADLLEESTEHDLNLENYLGNMSREMNIIIANEGTEDVPVYTVRVNNTYRGKDTALTTLGLEADDVSVQGSGNISNTKADRLPRSVYVYFEGMEKSTTTDVLDNIKITNTTGKEIDVYLIRIQDKQLAQRNTAAVETYNSDYGSKVEVFSTKTDGTESHDVEVIYNLRYNLSYSYAENIRKYNEDGSLADGATADMATQYKNDRALLYYNGNVVDKDTYERYFYDGYKMNEKNILYDVTLEIYDAGTSNKVATYSGGLTD